MSTAKKREVNEMGGAACGLLSPNCSTLYVKDMPKKGGAGGGGGKGKAKGGKSSGN